MINQKEARNLLIVNEWPDNYRDEELEKHVEVIMHEFQELRGDDSYLKSIREEDKKINKDSQLLILYGIRQMFPLFPEKAKETIEKCGLSYISIEEIDRAIKQREFDRQVQEIQENNRKKAKDTGIRTFEEIITPMVTYFPNLSFASVRDITVKEFCALDKSYKAAIKAEIESRKHA